MRRKTRILALLLALVMLSGLLCGCSEEKLLEYASSALPDVVPGKTISSDSKWINSDIVGAVDETVQVSEKDDFHTAVNMQWLLDTEVDSKMGSVDSFSATNDALDEAIKTLFTADPDFEVDENLMSKSQYEHVEALVTALASLVGDADRRDQLGAEPLRKYIERIEQITTLDDLTEYLKNTDGMKLCTDYPADFEVNTPPVDRDKNTVLVTPAGNFSLGAQEEYSEITSAGMKAKEYNRDALLYVLGDLGYDEKQVDSILYNCYMFENELAYYMLPSYEQQVVDYASTEYKVYTLDELQQLTGNYPISEILAAYGLDGSDTFTVYESSYMKSLSHLYTDKWVEGFKDYYIVHSIIKALPTLDSNCYDLAIQRSKAIAGYDSSSEDEGNDSDENESAEDEKAKEIYELQLGYLQTYIPDVLDQLYVARYCTAQDKQNICDMIDDIIAYYRVMLSQEEWLTEETREKAIEKLDNICVRALYPDELKDFSDLNIDPDGTLIDALNAVNIYDAKVEAENVNKAIDKSGWLMSTLTVNAGYSPTDNSINIFAGLLADDFFYDADDPYEKNLGRIGVVIGHEITHAFDTTGYKFDKDGVMQSWWTSEDEEAFQLRANRLAKYYGALTPVSGNPYTAAVDGEAIADMGAVKCALALAKEHEGFDYKLFFESYAQLWRAKRSYMQEITAAKDVHPLNFLRTNVTLQQFDEFYETFGIKPGDGMYVAPENRILVW